MRIIIILIFYFAIFSLSANSTVYHAWNCEGQYFGFAKDSISLQRVLNPHKSPCFYVLETKDSDIDYSQVSLKIRKSDLIGGINLPKADSVEILKAKVDSFPDGKWRLFSSGFGRRDSWHLMPNVTFEIKNFLYDGNRIINHDEYGEYVTLGSYNGGFPVGCHRTFGKNVLQAEICYRDSFTYVRYEKYYDYLTGKLEKFYDYNQLLVHFYLSDSLIKEENINVYGKIINEGK